MPHGTCTCRTWYAGGRPEHFYKAGWATTVDFKVKDQRNAWGRVVTYNRTRDRGVRACCLK